MTDDIETTEYYEIRKPGGAGAIALTDAASGRTALTLSFDGQTLEVDWALVEAISKQFDANDFSIIHAIARALVLARHDNFTSSHSARCDHDWQDSTLDSLGGGPPVCAKCGLTDRRIG